MYVRGTSELVVHVLEFIVRTYIHRPASHWGIFPWTGWYRPSYVKCLKCYDPTLLEDSMN